MEWRRRFSPGFNQMIGFSLPELLRRYVQATVGAHTASVDRTNLTSRQMNGRLVRKTLSFSKELRLLEATSCWEDAVYNFTRPMKTLRVEQEEHAGSTRWRQRTPAMAAGLDFSCLDRPGAFNLRACSFFYHYLIGRLPERCFHCIRLDLTRQGES